MYKVLGKEIQMCILRKVTSFNTSLPNSFIKLSKRSVVIPSGLNKRRRRKTRSPNVQEFTLDKSFDLNNARDVEFKVKQLQEFTKNLREQIKLTDSLVRKEKVLKEQIDSEIMPRDDENLYNGTELFLSKHPNKITSQTHLIPNTKESTAEPHQDLSSIILSSSQQVSKFLPKQILTRIGDDNLVLKSLIDRKNRDWNAIVSKLYATEEKLNGISLNTLKKSLLPKLKRLSFENTIKLDQMLMANVGSDITKFSIPMYECIFLNLSDLKPLKNEPAYNEKIIETMKMLLARFDEAIELQKNQAVADKGNLNLTKLEMNQFILNTCIKFASKLLDFRTMEFFLSKFNKDYNVKPNRENYTTVIQFYTKIGVSKQAWDIFDTMKFLSLEHKPDEITYNTMLHLCNKEKNYAKAINLYNEMIDLGINPSIKTLNIMSKTMATASSDSVVSEGKSESLRLLGWKYIHEIENNPQLRHQKHESNNYYHTLTSMLALSAYDGDVGLARALYHKYITSKFKENVVKWKVNFADSNRIDYKKVWRNTLDPQLFNYLLLAYSNYSNEKLPILLGYEQGAILRRNILNSADYVGRTESGDVINAKLPMLPVIDMNQPWQIFSESRALWQFNLEFGGTIDLRDHSKSTELEELSKIANESQDFDVFKFRIMHQIAVWKNELANHEVLNLKSLTTFLSIPIRLNDRTEFLLRLKEFTFENHVLEDKLSEEFYRVKEVESDTAVVHSTGTSQVEKKEGNSLNSEYFFALKHKLLVNCTIYEIIMKAAIKFHDIELATDAWKNRGLFRKTSAFEKLSAKEKRERDTEFASLMVQFFTQERMYTDAMGIIMSSQKFIGWRYPMVKELHNRLVEMEDRGSVKILLEIVNKKSRLEELNEEIETFQL